MKYAIDLHIHTCLSPCADDDMTPNNIVNMSRIKGLDIIAITDHNAAGNCAAVLEAAGGSGLLVVPGMELCTADEIHLLVLFSDTDTAIGFQEQVFRNLLPVKNREDVFARQVYMNSFDEETGTEDRFLIGACMICTQDAILMARSMGGAVLPAHVDRESFSMLQTLVSFQKNTVLSTWSVRKTAIWIASFRRGKTLGTAVLSGARTPIVFRISWNGKAGWSLRKKAWDAFWIR